MPAKRVPKQKAATKKYTAFLCSHTHWDREWYGSFQQYRFRLVRLIDNLMDLLERDPKYRCFNLDGQTVVLEDYLEVKPEQRERLVKLIRKGRIAVGPWYILPDEWLVSGESTVRNVLRARQVCRELGVPCSGAGYLPDMFGHVSQMPQLLRETGIDAAIMWRGLSGEQYKSELWWESPDGTRVLAFHLPEYAAYGNAALFYHSLPPEARTLEPQPAGWEMVNENVEFVSTAFRAVADRAIKDSLSGQLLFMNGIDHMEPQPQIPEIIRLANQKLEDVEIRHATFAEFLEALRAKTPKDLQVIRGELRSTAVARGSQTYVLPNIMSSRIYLKTANAKCQTLLERWTEPFASFASWLGGQYPQGLIRTGWKWLLRNHPHDSIGGCSIDEVHRQMETRFEWAEDIAQTVTNSSLHQITQAVNTEGVSERERAFCLFNPLNWEVSDLVVVDIDLEDQFFISNGIALNGENVNLAVRDLRITDWAGKPVEYEVLDVSRVTLHRPWINCFVPLTGAVRVRVALHAEKLPALGYRTYRVSPAAKIPRLRDRRGWGSAAVLENEHMRVEFDENGTLEISGKLLGGKELEGLHYFEDGGDNGDGYTYSPPRHDVVVTTLGGPAQISALTRSSAVQEVAVDYTMDVPASVTPDRQHRSGEKVPLKIRSVFRLGVHSKRIDVETTVTNLARDHRLRVCFDVPKGGNTHVAEMQFDVVERANQVVQPSEELWIEDMPLEQPQQGFVSYSNLALANFGIPEYEVVPGSRPVVKLTLLRAANYLGAGNHLNTIANGAGPCIETPEQQMIGRTLVFRYSIIPHKGDWVKAGVQRQAHQHNALWRGAVTDKHPGSLSPDGTSFLRITGDGIMMSAVKQVEDTPGEYIVRFWNAGDRESEAVLQWAQKPSAVMRSNASEDTGRYIRPDANGVVTIPMRPKQITTIRFRMAGTKGRTK